MEEKLECLVDSFTNKVLSLKYGEKFDSIENVEDYPEINDDWEYINNETYELARKIFDC